MKPIALILMILAAAATAGEEKPADVLTLLGSEVASERATGAYLAGKHEVEDAIPKLIDLVRTVPHHKDKEGQLVVRAAFDALIRMKVPVTPKVLEPHLSARFRTQALILLAPHAGMHTDLLLRQFDTHGRGDVGPHGIAIGNLLTKYRVPGFAPRLLRNLTFRLHVTIVDSGFAGRGGSSSLRVGCGDGRLDVPEGFPPTVFYNLTRTKRPGAVLLTDGSYPVYWYRTERTGRRLGFGSTRSSVEIGTLSRSWLRRLAGIPKDKLPLRAFASTSVAWTTAEAYVKHVAARRDAILAEYWKLVRALVAKEVLALDEARTLKPKVPIEVEDDREAPTGEPPAIPAPAKRPALPGEEPETRDSGEAPAK